MNFEYEHSSEFHGPIAASLKTHFRQNEPPNGSDPCVDPYSSPLGDAAHLGPERTMTKHVTQTNAMQSLLLQKCNATHLNCTSRYGDHAQKSV